MLLSSVKMWLDDKRSQNEIEFESEYRYTMTKLNV